MSGRTTPPSEPLDARSLRFAVVVSRFNEPITSKLKESAVRCLEDHGARTVSVHEVAGAFELPLACRELALEPAPDGLLEAALSRAAGERRARYDAIIALGCVIRGETPHFDYVAGETARGIMQAMLDTGVPIAFGVLTTETLAQAEARAGGAVGDKGTEAALTAIEMALLMREIRKRG